MPEVPDPRFELNKITPTEWLIHDLHYRDDDPRRIVACVYEYSDVEVEVVWLRDLPLATRYMTPFIVLDELVRVCEKDRSAPPVALVPLAAPALAS